MTKDLCWWFGFSQKFQKKSKTARGAAKIHYGSRTLSTPVTSFFDGTLWLQSANFKCGEQYP